MISASEALIMRNTMARCKDYSKPWANRGEAWTSQRQRSQHWTASATSYSGSRRCFDPGARSAGVGLRAPHLGAQRQRE